ncbi:MAG TPA: hypothetical protein VN643_08930 [Pyrinomonadaceae bacterium]|nr:hypothetical protein [Pyrinomonadaceae bacterium]
MKRADFLLVIAMICALPFAAYAQTQSDEVPRYEVGAQFTSITKPNFDGGRTEIGVGGRFTFNLNRSVALEAVGNFFPHKCSGCGSAGDNNGNITQFMAGLKAGKRFQKWGIFAKGRPGLVSFSRGDSGYQTTGGGGPFPFQFVRNRLTNFAMDVGGVLEFYPSKRIVTRFDGGDTIIRYRSRTTNFVGFDPVGGFVLFPFNAPAETRHNFQFSAGVGFRF